MCEFYLIGYDIQTSDGRVEFYFT